MFPTQYFDVKALTIVLSSLTVNTDLIVTIVSWTIIHPMMWYYYGFDTWYKVLIQLWIMAVHTIPLMAVSINYALLTDAPLYISDAWIMIVVTLAYVIVNYYFYHKTGSILYIFMDWSKPD